MKVILDEVALNAEFGRRLEGALFGNQRRTGKPKTKSRRHTQLPTDKSKRAHRRDAAVLDPIEVSRQGESVLRTRLAELTVDQLKDIVAEYGMDSGKLAMKWKAPDRLVERIVEVSLGRAKKGDAFLAPADSATRPPDAE